VGGIDLSTRGSATDSRLLDRGTGGDATGQTVPRAVSILEKLATASCPDKAFSPAFITGGRIHVGDAIEWMRTIDHG